MRYFRRIKKLTKLSRSSEALAIHVTSQPYKFSTNIYITIFSHQLVKMLTLMSALMFIVGTRNRVSDFCVLRYEVCEKL